MPLIQLPTLKRFYLQKNLWKCFQVHNSLNSWTNPFSRIQCFSLSTYHLPWFSAIFSALLFHLSPARRLSENVWNYYDKTSINFETENSSSRGDAHNPGLNRAYTAPFLTEWMFPCPSRPDFFLSRRFLQSSGVLKSPWRILESLGQTDTRAQQEEGNMAIINIVGLNGRQH